MSKDPVKKVQTLNKKQLRSDISDIQTGLLELLEALEDNNTHKMHQWLEKIVWWVKDLDKKIGK
jgi:hypothetical protein